MQIIKHEKNESIDKAINQDEPLMAVITFDGKKAIVSHMDEAVEHHILVNKSKIDNITDNIDVEKCFRIIFDKEGCDWTFICPSDYKGIKDKERRIKAFYNDGFATIAMFLSSLNYYVDINIPKRYRRHLNFND